MSALFEARGLSRRFGQVHALDKADFDVDAGEVVALIGDNGAGKSTLVKALSGNLDVDRERSCSTGSRSHFATPHEASAARHRDRVPGPRARTAPRRGPEHVPRSGDHAARPVREARLHGQHGDARQGRRGLHRARRDRALGGRAGRLHVRWPAAGGRHRAGGGVGQQGGLPRRADRRARRACRRRTCSRRSSGSATSGIAVVFIWHSMPHVIEVADRVQVLRLGRRVATYQAADTSVEQLVGAMTGALDRKEGAA